MAEPLIIRTNTKKTTNMAKFTLTIDIDLDVPKLVSEIETGAPSWHYTKLMRPSYQKMLIGGIMDKVSLHPDIPNMSENELERAIDIEICRQLSNNLTITENE